jgi:signal transduction histidine kinase
VAHEINNPLAYVSNNLAVLARDVRLVAELVGLYRAHLGDAIPGYLAEAEEKLDLNYTLGSFDRLIESSQKGLKRVREIVGALRDFSRLDQAERKEIDPNEVVRDTIEIVRFAASERAVDLRVDLAESLPTILCSPGKLNQVLLNILLNAIQAVEHGSWVEALTRYEAAREEVCYEVADAGPGIPDAIRGRIFDPFFTTKPPGVGTGLGLWVSYNIVTDHGGRIEVQTQAGRGTTFTIALPVKERRLEDQG